MEDPPFGSGGFFLYVCLIFGYYRLWIVKDFERDLDSFRNHLFTVSDAAGAELEAAGMQLPNLRASLTSMAARQHVKLSIYDIDGNRLFEVDRRQAPGVSNLEQKSFVATADNKVLVLELSYPFTIQNFGEINAVRRFIRFSLLFFVGMLFLLMVYLHYSLVKPLMVLNHCLATVDLRFTAIANPLKRQDELGELGRKYEQMLTRLKTANQQQIEMIASISHDLKTPLTSISGYLERLIAGKVGSEAKRREYELIIYQKAQEMQALIQEFNHFTVTDLECAALERQSVRLSAFVEELCREYRSELEVHQVRLDWSNQLPPDLDCRLEPLHIRRVFANLVENTVRYATGADRIRITAVLEQQQAVFRFEDNGPGVPEAELGALFDRFYRVDKSRSREKGGSGLGLAICRTIIESHGGSIAAYQAPGGGLGVRFSLKLD